MRLVCISDTHNRHREIALPEGDVLVHAGDMTMRGSPREIQDVADWMGSLPHPVKIAVAGNHDWLFQREPARARRIFEDAGVVYLQDQAYATGGLRFWGSPWQPWMMSWAFNLPRGERLREKWDLIPSGVDVLVTHGPPHGILDRVERFAGRVFSLAMRQGEHVGCEELLLAVQRVRPRVHVFGHIHEGYGLHESDGSRFVNASFCDLHYKPGQPPLVVDVQVPAVTGSAVPPAPATPYPPSGESR